MRHAHTSGGRLPTERGLRYYVDTLLRVRSLTSGEKDEIRERLAPAGRRRARGDAADDRACCASSAT